ncbi:hypothetical protein K490DRAFT_68697 [Saccharata proteae CBS 121410]|uniref:Uncharacterized protein n=1 Tax=Saccharata proteae CBS 121410 TaxID=1314787 RepID=A0A9P4HS20_9PEZI|nr:hypothetical protein K490DRAFT_68697 [Saccharata proteae CBS 121410]
MPSSFLQLFTAALAAVPAVHGLELPELALGHSENALVYRQNANTTSPVVTSGASTVVIVDVQPAISTSTVYETQEITITSCPPEITSCPVSSMSVVTSIVAVSTTICPITLTTSYFSEITTSFSPVPAPSTPAVLSSSSILVLIFHVGVDFCLFIGTQLDKFGGIFLNHHGCVIFGYAHGPDHHAVYDSHDCFYFGSLVVLKHFHGFYLGIFFGVPVDFVIDHLPDLFHTGNKLINSHLLFPGLLGLLNVLGLFDGLVNGLVGGQQQQPFGSIDNCSIASRTTSTQITSSPSTTTSTLTQILSTQSVPVHSTAPFLNTTAVTSQIVSSPSTHSSSSARVVVSVVTSVITPVPAPALTSSSPAILSLSTTSTSASWIVVTLSSLPPAYTWTTPFSVPSSLIPTSLIPSSLMPIPSSLVLSVPVQGSPASSSNAAVPTSAPIPVGYSIIVPGSTTVVIPPPMVSSLAANISSYAPTGNLSTVPAPTSVPAVLSSIVAVPTISIAGKGNFTATTTPTAIYQGIGAKHSMSFMAMIALLFVLLL